MPFADYVQQGAYLVSIPPVALLYSLTLNLGTPTTPHNSIVSELSASRSDRIKNSARFIRIVEEHHRSEVAHLQRSIERLGSLLDESRESEARQARRVERKVGQERRLSAALAQQLTIAHASNAQTRRRVLEISHVCSRVRSNNERLKAANDELRLVSQLEQLRMYFGLRLLGR